MVQEILNIIFQVPKHGNNNLLNGKHETNRQNAKDENGQYPPRNPQVLEEFGKRY